MLKKALIKTVHVGKAKLKMDDETYKTMLFTLTGRTSSTQCSIEQLKQIVEVMRKNGFTQSPKHKRPSVSADKKTVINKIGALLEKANRSWNYARGMSRQMFQREQLEWLTVDELQRLMQALIIDARRHGREK